MTVRRILAVWLVALLAAPAARAQPAPTPAALAAEGKKLLAEGRTGEACARLAESLARRALLTTRLALADCQEKDGKLAAAHRTLGDAAAQARRLGDRRAAAIRSRVAALEPRLPRLTIRYAPGAVRADLQLAVDGA